MRSLPPVIASNFPYNATSQCQVQAGPGERLAEGRAMSVTFGVSQRPIHVKNEGRERHFLYIIK